jgi:hypothetical protein
MISVSSNNTKNPQIAFNRSIEFTSAGILEPTDGHKLYHEQSLSLSVLNVNDLNEVEVQAKLTNSDNWVTIKTIIGQTGIDVGNPEIINISKYDLIRFNVTSFAQYGAITPKLIVSAFFNPVNDLDYQIESNENLETTLIELIKTQNKLMNRLNSNVETLKKSMERIEEHLNIITDLNC